MQLTGCKINASRDERPGLLHDRVVNYRTRVSKRQRMEAATIGDFLVLVWVWAVGSDPVGDMRTVFKP